MLRTALKPRWIALLVVVLLLATGMAMLGEWQFHRATATKDEGPDALGPARPISQVISPRETFPAKDADAVVTAVGHWDPAHQLLVPERRQEGRTGLWVLTPLVLPDGSAVPVVRGWVPSADAPAALATSLSADAQVSVTGSLRPTEPAVDRAPGSSSGLPAGQIDRIDATQLITDWPYPLITGYVAQTAVSPAAAAGAPAPEAIPALPESRGGVDWRNVSYAIQWWVFAGCGLFLWWRLVQDDFLGRGRPGAGSAEPDGVGDHGSSVPATRGATP